MIEGSAEAVAASPLRCLVLTALIYFCSCGANWLYPLKDQVAGPAPGSAQPYMEHTPGGGTVPGEERARLPISPSVVYCHSANQDDSTGSDHTLAEDLAVGFHISGLGRSEVLGFNGIRAHTKGVKHRPNGFIIKVGGQGAR